MSDRHGLIGPYRVLGLVGGGGQGSVYLGYDQRLQRRVAIKVHRLPPGVRARRDALREARSLARIRDPRVVQIYDVVESTDFLALVMEYLPGCDLETVLARRRLSLASVLLVTRDVAAGIAAARRHRVVHGDIKASNVLIGRDGRIRLGDFGIAQRYAATGEAGSAGAVAPEQCTGGKLDVRTDLFALGRLLYRLLAGTQPFDVTTPAGMADLLAGRYPPITETLPDTVELPPDLASLLADLLQADPAARPRNTQPVRNRLRRIVASLPLNPRNPLLPEAEDCFRPEPDAQPPLGLPTQLSQRGKSRNQQLAQRQRWLASLRSARVRAVAAGLLLALVAGVSWWHTRPPYGIHVNMPVLALEPGSLLEERLGTLELAVLVGEGLRTRLGAVQLSGAVPLRTLRVGDDREAQQVAPSEWLDVSLQCGERLCILALFRRFPGGDRAQRDLLFPDASPEQWQHDINRAVTTLYADWQR